MTATNPGPAPIMPEEKEIRTTSLRRPPLWLFLLFVVLVLLTLVLYLAFVHQPALAMAEAGASAAVGLTCPRASS